MARNALATRHEVPRSVVVADRVRWSDVDAAGIVCFGRYFRFFELAETELFCRSGLPVSVLVEQHRIWFVRRRVECDFVHPLRLDEEVQVDAHVAEIGDSSVQLAFVVRVPQHSAVVATGRYVLVSVDRATLEKRRIPTDVRRALDPFRHAPQTGDTNNQDPVDLDRATPAL